MNTENSSLSTPIYLKTSEHWSWPEHESLFYLLTRDGLFLCRDHAHFRACVRAPEWPDELAPHQPSLELRYPKLPQELIEQIVGFFGIIAKRAGAEAAVLLAWDSQEKQIRAIAPPQVSLVSRGWTGAVFPISVHYETPPLPPGWTWIGDVHCHVEGDAYASLTDQQDEAHRPGMHIVVGRISEEPPQFHIEVTVDRQRFRVADTRLIFEGYQQRRPDLVPSSWVDKVTVKPWAEWNSDAAAGSGKGDSHDAKHGEPANGAVPAQPHQVGAPDTRDLKPNSSES